MGKLSRSCYLGFAGAVGLGAVLYKFLQDSSNGSGSILSNPSAVFNEAASDVKHRIDSATKDATKMVDTAASVAAKIADTAAGVAGKASTKGLTELDKAIDKAKTK